jgi:hypothetical protein
LKVLESHVERLSNQGDHPLNKENHDSVDTTSEIFDEILKDPDMQDLEPTSPLRDYEPMDRTLDETPTEENQSIEINFVDPDPEPDNTGDASVSHDIEPLLEAEPSDEMVVVSEKETVETVPQEEEEDESIEDPSDPSLLKLPVLKQHVIGMCGGGSLFLCLSGL